MKPIIINAAKAHKKKQILYRNDGSAILMIGGHKKVVPKENQFDLTQATIFGLNERLTMAAQSPVINKKGQTLRDLFNNEWVAYDKALSSAEGGKVDYGVYAYYADKNHLVKYCAPEWHRIVAVASSSMLLSDPKGAMSWSEIQNHFHNSTIAVAGASVGNNCAHAIAMDIRPGNLKIADKSLYKMENINRVRLTYSDMVDSGAKRKTATDTLLRNKAIVTASQIYAIDPFINIHVYSEGVSENNIKNFLDGSGKEPAANILVEEVDDPRVKILLREMARRMQIPLVMVTDMGSAVQLDILRYDQNKGLGLTYGASDKELYAKMNKVYDNPGNRSTFYEFVDTLIGKDYRQNELKMTIEGKCEIPTSTIIPQLGSTAAVAGGIAAEAVARILLDHNYPPRMIINKQTFASKIYH